ncbi:hypothetical protein Pmani_010372 [Petrolisthes manimaculis]|uniref:Uncharacterized protein n=1 Tax=Petrolisthes manimaculis TaxID=1843537 RepID=A0AAE1Q2A7_9EUCA|nr:hypothetical protein Pmani_010372 [Petrolisthes manimaculis]
MCCSGQTPKLLNNSSSTANSPADLPPRHVIYLLALKESEEEEGMKVRGRMGVKESEEEEEGVKVKGRMGKKVRRRRRE